MQGAVLMVPVVLLRLWADCRDSDGLPGQNSLLKRSLVLVSIVEPRLKCRYHENVSPIDKTLAQMRASPQNVRYADLLAVCVALFGPPRQSGSSHAVFRTPWPGDPRVNIQSDRGKAKAYQVRQVLKAIDLIGDPS